MLIRYIKAIDWHDRYLWVALGVACGAALCCIYGGGWVVVLGKGAIVLLGLAALVKPEIGLVSIFPVLSFLPAVPRTVGVSEAIYAWLLGATFLGAVMQHRGALVSAIQTHKSWAALMSLILVFSVMNLVTASMHGIAFLDWLRGLTPFFFIIMFVPIGLVFRHRPAARRLFYTSLTIAAAFFAVRIIQTYITEQLWLSHWYLHEEGRWIRIETGSVSLYPVQMLHRFMMRVTMLLPQATDALVPIGIVWGVAGAVFTDSRIIRRLALCVAVIATAAVILTYTRSMLLSAFIVLLGIGLVVAWSLNVRLILRYIVAGFILAATAVTLIISLSLEPIYLNRFMQLVSFAKDVGGNLNVRTSADQLIPELEDINVTTRLDEYRTAWGLFREAPFTGQGLGVKHPMVFPSYGNGTDIKLDVGYIHNWVFYVLMTGGVPGLIIYSFLILGPIFLAVWSGTGSRTFRIAVVSSLAFLIIYGLFFAVFRLISFNLLLASAWGLALASVDPERETSSCAG